MKLIICNIVAFLICQSGCFALLGAENGFRIEKAIFKEHIDTMAILSVPETSESQKIRLIEIMKSKNASNDSVEYVMRCKHEINYVCDVAEVLGPEHYEIVSLYFPFSKNKLRRYFWHNLKAELRIDGEEFEHSNILSKHQIPKAVRAAFGNNVVVDFCNPDLDEISFDQEDGDYPGGIFIRYPIINMIDKTRIGWLKLTFMLSRSGIAGVYVEKIGKN
jgi:hypothetical protein